MRVLLLSAYDADSHKRWRRGLVAALPEWEWTVLTLPPRYFSWRIRGNSLSWGRGEAAEILRRPWDLILATSMTDLAALRGLVPDIAAVPTAVYFHENQFAYPVSENAFSSIEPQLLNIYTALSGDLLLFNSGYNRRTLLAGAAALLKRFPDQVPPDICDEIERKSQVLPVPLESKLLAAPPDSCPAFTWNRDGERESPGRRFPAPDCLKIVWNGRHEYDKGPDRLLAVLRRLEHSGLDYRIAVVGQQFRSSPKELAVIQSQFSHRLARFGYLESAEAYRACLQSADIVLSTAIHEFQGLAVLEAIAAACLPVLPDRQVYPELVPREFLYRSCDDISEEATEAVNLITRLAKSKPSPPDVSRFSWEKLKAEYKALFTEISSLRLP